MGNHRIRVAPLVVLAVVAVVLGGTLGWVRRPPASLTGETSAQSTDTRATTDFIAVHVAGWVVSPGVVSLPAGAIVADAVAAAGGLLPAAATESLNLAAPVSEGEQVVVPGPESVPGHIASEPGDGLISLNQAPASDLDTLPGVGPVLAERIVAFREENGRFEVVEDLLEVPGIGEAKLASLRDLVKP